MSLRASFARHAPPIGWQSRPPAPLREYVEVLAVVAVVTVVAWFVPIDYRAFGDIYLLAVIVLCLRVGPRPIVFASIASVLAWNYFIVPPRLAFAKLNLKDAVFLGMYFVVALVAGLLTARIRRQQQEERQREQRATALFHLTRALSAARTLDEGLAAALRQADALFGVRTAVLLYDENGKLVPHPTGTLPVDATELAAAHAVCAHAKDPAPHVPVIAGARALHLPIVRPGAVLGTFSLQPPAAPAVPPAPVHELMEAFAAQIGLLAEREQLRTAGEREKLLAESDRLHRTLLDSVSHELKTPVAVLRSAAEGLAREEGARRELLAREIRTAARRLDHLVANLLNQTRLEAGRLRPQLDWCDVRDLIGAARRAVGDGLERHPLTVDVPADMPFFRADAILMEQVLANLLLNVVHHTPPGTAVTIAAGRESDRIYVSVADRGPGIPPALREKLFQKFERGDHARAGGLGLGLSIVHGFMLAQGGDVTAGENPRGGACFTVYLPYQAHASVPHE